jgi:cell wall-associated NlpC family hydrolase
MPDGFLMRLTSDSYTRVRVDIHVPEEEEGPRRSPQALKWVSLTKWIGLPAEGQRVAISNRTIGRENRYEGTTCEEIQKWHPKKCTSMTEAIRRTLIAAANPEDFKNSRYKSPPREGTKIEEDVDCSSFVNEVFRRAGIEYPYTPTANMRCLKTFSEVPQSDAKTGDLILYQGHVGILDDDGLVISATVGGPGRRSMRLPTDPGFLSAITRLKRDQVHAGKWVILRWRCP